MLEKGIDGEPLPDYTWVLRIGMECERDRVALNQGKALETLFSPSTNDRESKFKRISIWVEELTIADQGWEIMGANPKRTFVACLKSEAIRAITIPDCDASPCLSADWETALLPDGMINTQPGAEGHAGIGGLLNESHKKNLRKVLRSKLADIAIISPVPVPHDIPESQLEPQQTIDDNAEQSAELIRVNAIRQIRRMRFAEHLSFLKTNQSNHNT